MKIEKLLDKLIFLKLFEFLKKEEPEEQEKELTPKEKLIELYVNPKEDNLSKKVDNHFVEISKMVKSNDKIKIPDWISLKEEALKKDKEMIEKDKAEMGKEREHLESQQATLKTAFQEARSKNLL